MHPSPLRRQLSDADSRRSSFSSVLEDVLQPGDLVGEGVTLLGETLRLVSLNAHQDMRPAREFEVVRRLGAGTYAVIYQVLEVLERAPRSENGYSSMIGPMDLNGRHTRGPSTMYGREYAIKCLSKANLDDEALTALMGEVRRLLHYLSARAHLAPAHYPPVASAPEHRHPSPHP
jgi:hypothetical protein